MALLRRRVGRYVPIIALAQLVALASPGFGQDGDARRRIDECVQKAVQSRALIVSYHLIAIEETKWSNEPGQPDHRSKYRFEVWYRNGSMRTDRTVVESNRDVLAGQIGQRNIVCRNCERPGYAITTNQGKNFVSPVKYTKIDNEFDARDFLKFDWRLMGHMNESLSQYQAKLPSDSFRSLQTIDNPKVETVEDGRFMLKKASVSAKPGSTFSCFFHPGFSGNPVAFSVTSASKLPGQKGLEKVTRIDYAAPGKSGIDYPKSIRHQVLQDGEATFDQSIVFELIELNEPIPDSVFTLAGFEMVKGTPVEVPEIRETRKQPTWGEGSIDYERTRGKQIDSVYKKMQAELQAQPVPDTPESRRTWPYYIATAFGLVALGLFAKILKSRRATR